MITIALAVAVIAMTLTQSSLFRAIQKCKLLRCPYCTAHYVSFLIWLCQPKTNLLDFVINVFATIAISVLPMIVIDHLNTRMDKHAKILHSSHSTL
ncbi:hypothetical protein LCGC14_2563290 [marine sediment metagenome]|uniref:Uncharacterized protein n=1 Tax=marine sediment metagenome TaxID=412755 RepID=A0A0F9AK25_9ZZZZ